MSPKPLSGIVVTLLIVVLWPPGCTRTTRPPPARRDQPQPKPSVEFPVPGEGKRYMFTGAPVRIFVPPREAVRLPGIGAKKDKHLFNAWVKTRRDENAPSRLPPTVLLDYILFNELTAWSDRTSGAMAREDPILTLLPPLAGQNIVDFAAGTGRMMKTWVKTSDVRRVLMADVDPVAIDVMAERIAQDDQLNPERERFILLQSRPDNPCLPEGWANAILCSNMHSWVMRNHGDPAQEVKAFWQKMSRGLARGGRLLIIDQCNANPKPCQEASVEQGNTWLPIITKVPGLKLTGFHLDLPKKGQWAATFQRD